MPAHRLRLGGARSPRGGEPASRCARPDGHAWNGARCARSSYARHALRARPGGHAWNGARYALRVRCVRRPDRGDARGCGCAWSSSRRQRRRRSCPGRRSGCPGSRCHRRWMPSARRSSEPNRPARNAQRYAPRPARRAHPAGEALRASRPCGYGGCASRTSPTSRPSLPFRRPRGRPGPRRRGERERASGRGSRSAKSGCASRTSQTFRSPQTRSFLPSRPVPRRPSGRGYGGYGESSGRARSPSHPRREPQRRPRRPSPRPSRWAFRKSSRRGSRPSERPGQLRRHHAGAPPEPEPAPPSSASGSHEYPAAEPGRAAARPSNLPVPARSMPCRTHR